MYIVKGHLVKFLGASQPHPVTDLILGGLSTLPISAHDVDA